ncbi:FAD-dependent oxidoreductase [Levilactobacillus tujiorum]|uniref:FAD-dependent oxidoreductase n=1 Tax=Levilactobacillus tujiorum TaxID=2912243 RepID=A0ABX1L6V3_9LACO|nr:FAD-dependent oxidoreductase [Levilactobacillus tujiorum]MCH5465375.1 FAD-dependent oxidoreductase [Levilactobacillus tujiorum]NLR12337.1 FAD-dependent oxidoreductase [Lactobacillus sp. HBUAS51387]NLR30378.1 FAD-dependent oxidoreductase [Levilactobacillus tujiorum]
MKVIIVGSTHAGTNAALQILQDHPETDVTIYERHTSVSFLSCGISLFLDGQVKHLEDMFYSSPEALAEAGAKVLTRRNVIKIDSENKSLEVVDMDTGDLSTDTYDKLIMATGSTVTVPPIFGIDEDKVMMCKNYDQAVAISKAAKGNKRIAIVGAGYIGTELAESYARTGHDVQLLQSRDIILNHYVDKELSDHIVSLLEDNGVKVMLNRRVTSFTGDENGQLVIETTDGNFTADMAVVCTGFVPNTELLRGQVDMDRHGAIIINDYVQSSDPDIFACGDASVVNFNPTGKPAYTPLATNAVRQGMLAGINIFGNIQKYMGTQATSAMQIFGRTLASTGLTIDHALKAGMDADQVTFQGTWRPKYMPSTDDLTINLVYNRQNRRVLGAQLLSQHEVAQSANAISIAIQNRNTIDDLAFVDMLFNPNFDAPFNYLNIVAQMAVEKETKRGNNHPRLTAGMDADPEKM